MFDLSLSSIDTAPFTQEIRDIRLVITGQAMKKEIPLHLSEE